MGSIGVEQVPLMFKGVFDFNSVYNACINWNKKYCPHVFETLYKDKISGPGVREVEIWLTAFVNMNEWLRWETKIILKAWDVKELEQTNENGFPLMSGRMELVVQSTLVTDYQKTYDGTSYALYLGKILSRFWQKGTLSDEYGSAIGKQFELQNDCRHILGIETKQ